MAFRGGRRLAFGLYAALLSAAAGAYVPAPAGQPAVSASARREEPAGDLDHALLRLDGQQKSLEADLAAIGPQIDQVRQRMKARARQYYQLVKAGMLPLGGGFDDLVDHASRIERLRAALGRDLAKEHELSVRQASDRKQLRKVRTERAPLLVQREALRTAEQALQQADERRDAFQRAFGGSEDAPHATVYGAAGEALSDDPTSRFAAMRGRLSFPLAGRAEVRHDDSLGAGMLLRASRDTAVRAVYPGSVAFCGETDHGLTVVLDHGEHYYTTYGNLQRLDVKVGDALAERGRMGWIQRRSGKPAVLYFELRHGATLLDAGPWLGL